MADDDGARESSRLVAGHTTIASPIITSAQPDVTIDRVFLTFDDPTLEQVFRREYDERVAATTRLAIAAGSPGYVIMAVIIDDAEARRFAIAMLAVLVGWIAASWTRLFARYYNPITAAVVGVLTMLSMAMFLATPPDGAIVISIAFITLNFMWIFVFLRPRFPFGLAIGVGYLSTVVIGGSVVWDRFGRGSAPTGLIAPLGGPVGGAVIILAYAGFLLVLTATVSYRLERSERVDFLRSRELAAAHARSERLLNNVLPHPVAERLKGGENPIADNFADVSVVFADIAGFTEISATMDPGELLVMLNQVFTRFDELAAKHGLEKVKTIGDAYMAVGCSWPSGRGSCSGPSSGSRIAAWSR